MIGMPTAVGAITYTVPIAITITGIHTGMAIIPGTADITPIAIM